MEDSKWYNKILGIQEDNYKVNYRDKKIEIYELFKKNKYKKATEKINEKPKLYK
tara:strand:+ start:530 stop:691 length:162 start_codon:yes stop_codon:yes gene_type:complete